MKNKINFLDKNEIARRFGVDRREFHTVIKQMIVSDFKKELIENKIKNPDIGLDSSDYIYLSDIEHKKTIVTNLKVEDYS